MDSQHTKAQNSMDESQNPSSPYYLHLRENLGMVMVNPRLKGNNYHSWNRAMKHVLLSKNKFKFFFMEVLKFMPWINLCMMLGKDAMCHNESY